MKYRRIIAAFLVAATVFTGAPALAAGTTADPVVTRSYLKAVFNTPLEGYVQTALEGIRATLDAKVEGIQTTATHYAREKVAAAYAERLGEAVMERVTELMSQQTADTLTAGMKQRTVVKGDKITGPAGASVMFVSGAGKVIGPAGSEILNITAGGTRQPGPAIRTNILYMMVADDGSGIEVTSDTAVVLVKDGARAGYEPQYTAYADAYVWRDAYDSASKCFAEAKKGYIWVNKNNSNSSTFGDYRYFCRAFYLDVYAVYRSTG